MTSDEYLMTMTAAARRAMADPGRSITVGNASDPLFELFHASSSLCSQKVRTVLHEKSLSYRSNDMLILSSMGSDGLVAAEHYNPAYIRLRLLGGRELRTRFVTEYSGRTSVDTEGFDPCVVPLLVDHRDGRVIADSQRICCYLDALSPDPIRLVPTDREASKAVMQQANIVDRIPNGALLYGFHPDADMRPDGLKTTMETVYDYKIMALESWIAANPGEPELIAAYRAKIAKESAGKQWCRDAAFQRAARSRVAELLRDLDRTLAAQPRPYLRGQSFTLADVFWGVNLVRLSYLGLAFLWDGFPNVARYLEALRKRPSLRQEAIQASIDSLPPCEYMATLDDSQVVLVA